MQGAGMRRLIALAVLATTLVGCRSSAVTVDGPPSRGASREFGLSAGNYSIEWHGVPEQNAIAVPECPMELGLYQRDGSFSFSISYGGSYTPGDHHSGGTATGVPSGTYVIEAITNCGWSVTFTPV